MKSLSELYDEIENGNYDSAKKEQIVNLVLQAANDWPSEILTLEGFIVSLKKITRSDMVNKEAIQGSLEWLKPEQHAWEIEALSSLLEIFELTTINDLEKIFSDI